jgi:hypothetical protein
MGHMKDVYTEQEETLYEEYLESQRNELRLEGQREACLMIKYDLDKKYESLTLWAKPSEAGPTALREAIEIVEKYL